MSKPVAIERTSLDTAFGNFDFFCFSWSRHEEDNILCELKAPLSPQPLVRIQSACYTAEIFRSFDCDCHAQLSTSLRRIGQEGGLLIYMLCDGRGAGLQKKVRGLALGTTEKLDTADAYHAMGLELDPREYERAAFVLDYFGLSEIRLLTNNPRKIDALVSCGVKVLREPLEIPSTMKSRDYLRTKANKMGHLLSEFTKQEN